MKRVFVTVGTTNFEELMKEIDTVEVFEGLKRLGFGFIGFQIGRGTYQPIHWRGRLEGEVFDFKPSLVPDIQKADLVISHCGAGTMLECLRMRKRIVGVINDSLMDNHQFELYDKLVVENHIKGLKSPTLILSHVSNEIY